jgi:tRNA-2-methylthio-N6-dimethylallyladenosine synthase
MPNQVEAHVADERLQRLNALIIEQQQTFKETLVGQTLPILFEKKGRYGRQAIGRSPYLQSVYVEDADHLMGQIVPVKIVALGNNSLQGALISPAIA